MASVRKPAVRNAVIVGGGVAGTVCSSELRALVESDFTEVILIDPQPAVKAASVIAKVTRSATDFEINEKNAAEWCQRNGISFVQDRACQLEANEVVCESGLRVSFTVCCIATGAKPWIPPAIQSSSVMDRVVTLRDTDSVSSLQAKLVHARRVLVVGSGGIAMELVHEMTNCEVVWVIKGTHMGSAFFDKRGAASLFSMEVMEHCESTSTCREGINSYRDEKTRQNLCRGDGISTDVAPGSGVGPDWISRRFEPVLLDKTGKVSEGNRTKYIDLHGTAATKNVRVAMNSEIRKLEKGSDPWEVNATLSDGSTVDCNLVLLGTGVTPNTEWLRGSAVDVDWKGLENPASSSEYDAAGGVLVSAEDFRTNVGTIFAAGDCATVRPVTSGCDWFQMRLWTQALTTGRACAQGMAQVLRGEDVEGVSLDFELFAHATKFFGKKVVFLGRYNAQGMKEGFQLLESGGGSKDGYYVRAVIEGGRMHGALLLGEVDAADTFENLILNGLDVSQFGAELVDPTIDIDDYFD